MKPPGSPTASCPPDTPRSSAGKVKDTVAHKDLEWCDLLRCYHLGSLIEQDLDSVWEISFVNAIMEG